MKHWNWYPSDTNKSLEGLRMDLYNNNVGTTKTTAHYSMLKVKYFSTMELQEGQFSTYLSRSQEDDPAKVLL